VTEHSRPQLWSDITISGTQSGRLVGRTIKEVAVERGADPAFTAHRAGCVSARPAVLSLGGSPLSI